MNESWNAAVLLVVMAWFAYLILSRINALESRLVPNTPDFRKRQRASEAARVAYEAAMSQTEDE